MTPRTPRTATIRRPAGVAWLLGRASRTWSGVRSVSSVLPGRQAPKPDGAFLRTVAYIFLAWWAGVLGASSAIAQGHPPDVAAARMRVAGGCEVMLVASEPLVRQPVAIDFDDRGRLWVLQYLQYPNPAGLERARVDRWSRTTYDRVPEPPPKGPRGADRLTILEDVNEDGRMDGAKDFAGGLNLASGFAFGHGGVFVVQVPYLLFYPDRDRNDVPDGDPEVCLTGFGMEDAHSVANSLTWGPDGWLYGCQGSTVTARIRGVEFQQGVWRYHPVTRRFELFCEGGGNSWGLDFDDEGELLFSTNVGPYRMLHARQGAYYWKSFGKHGALHNPYAFGYFEHVPHAGFRGGHVTVGGILYRGTNLPPAFRGRHIAGDLLGHGVQWHALSPAGSTFTSAHGGDLLAANDTWFGPSDVTMGPDGAVYVADWHDQRTAHPDPDAEWDRSNGRIYRIAKPGSVPIAVPPWDRLKGRELADLLTNPNVWIAQRARRHLAERSPSDAILPLREALFTSPEDAAALEALWALAGMSALSRADLEQLLEHRHRAVRSWAVRLMGDEGMVSAADGAPLVRLAEVEPEARVRAQLASTARRLDPATGLEVALALVRRDLDRDDPHIPFLSWWAIERHAVAGIAILETAFRRAALRDSALARDVIRDRLLRRWAAEGTSETLGGCARVIREAGPDRRRLLAAVEQGFRDRPRGEPRPGSGGLFAKAAAPELRSKPAPFRFETVPEALASELAAEWSDDLTDPAIVSLACRIGRAGGHARAVALATSPAAPLEVRVEMLRWLGEMTRPGDEMLILDVAMADGPEAIRLAAIESLGAFEQMAVASRLVAGLRDLPERLRGRCREVLLRRVTWATALLQAVDAGRLAVADVPVEQLRVASLHGDRAIDTLIAKHWGRIAGGSEEEKLAEMRRVNNDLRAGRGEAGRGRVVFQNLCAPCHTLHGQGGRVGPDLTHANRADLEFLLASIVDPSAVIRREHASHEIETGDGRLLTGLIRDPGAGRLVLTSASGESTVVARDQIRDLRPSAVSLMPEGLLGRLKPQELRDLFAYLQAP